MGKPLTIQDDDDRRIEELKIKTGVSTKIDVLRMALALLEREVERQAKIERWKRAAALVGAKDVEVNKDFQKSSRLKRIKD